MEKNCYWSQWPEMKKKKKEVGIGVNFFCFFFSASDVMKMTWRRLFFLCVCVFGCVVDAHQVFDLFSE